MTDPAQIKQIAEGRRYWCDWYSFLKAYADVQRRLAARTYLQERAG